MLDIIIDRHITDVVDGDKIVYCHPEQTARMPSDMRAFARMVIREVTYGNKDIVVFTTSDYFVIEVNIAISKQRGLYLNHRKVRCRERFEGKLVECDIDPEQGIEVRSFDAVINAQNKERFERWL